MRGWIVAGLVALAVSGTGVQTWSDVSGPAVSATPDIDGDTGPDAPDAFSREHRRHLRERAAADVATPAAPVDAAARTP